MASRLESIAVEAMTLTPEERIELADRLIASVFSNQDVDDAWAREVGQRVREIEAGRAPLIPATDAIARARSIIR